MKTKTLLACGVVSGPLFVLVFLVEGVTRALRSAAPPGQLACSRRVGLGADRQLHRRGPPDAGPRRGP
jgi:hypothetical protein